MPEWLDILNESDQGILKSPYDHTHRMALARSLFSHGYHYLARMLASGHICTILGREYFPPRVPSFSVHDADAHAHGVKMIPIFPKSNASDFIPGSVGIDPTPDCLRARPRWKRDHFVSVFDQGQCVVSPWGYAIFSKDGFYATDFCDYDGAMIGFSGIAPEHSRIEGTVAVCMHAFSNGVFHWLMETLPRFEMLSLAGLAPKVDYYAMREMAPWHWEFIDRMGIPREKFISLGNITNFQADQLLVCSSVEEADWTVNMPYFEAEPWVTDYLASLAPDTTNVPDAGDRVYVSREKAWSRKVGNGAELKMFLEDHGFRTVIFEDLNLAEKVAVMRGAEYIVSPSGAGMANIPFMRPGSKCMVLYCEDGVYSAKNVFCANTGVTHIHSISPAQSRFYPQQMLQVPENLKEIVVDMRRLAELFEDLRIERRR